MHIMFDYRNQPAYWINHAAYALRSELQRGFAAAGHDLTAQEWALLLMLWAEEPLSVNTLAARTLRDRTTVTRLLDRLADKALIERAPDPADRRRVAVRLTAEGRALEGPLTAIARAMIARAVNGIPPADIVRLNDTLRAMLSNLESHLPET